MKVYVQGAGTGVELTQRNFLAAGGQANVFVKGDLAYKVYHDPANAVPQGKIQALAAITDPQVNRPRDILLDAKNAVVGYTARYVKDAFVLAQLFPRAFRDRQGVTPEMILHLVRKMQEGIAHIHSKGILVVDLNELNFLVSPAFDELHFIDTDSYELPGYPAPVLMDSIRDWTVQRPPGSRHHTWTTLSDWWSFAIVSFQLFVGIHPFKGQYKGPKAELRAKLPTDKPDDAFAVTRRRMQQHVSVLQPDVGMPAAVYPLDSIPDTYRAWYARLFVRGERGAPPLLAGTVTTVVMAAPASVSSAQLEITEMGQYEGTITRLWSNGTTLVVATDKDVWLDQQRVGAPWQPHGCGFIAKSGRTILASTDGSLYNATDRAPAGRSAAASAVSSHGGRIYTLVGEQVLEVELHDMGRIVAANRAVVNVLPHATKLYRGVVVQNLLGSHFVSLLSAAGVARQVRMPELDVYRILDARFDNHAPLGGVLMVIGARTDGTYDRLVFRFGEDDSYDMRVVSNITPAGLNFVVLDSGVCVCLTEDDKLEAFPSKKGSTAMKVVEDKALGGDMILAKHAGSVLFARGNRIYRMKLK